MAQRGGRRKPVVVFSEDQATQELEAHQAMGVYMIDCEHAYYPTLLRKLEDAPPIISVKGDPEFLKNLSSKHCVAMVGTRHASLNALQYAKKLAQELGEAGCVIVSGLARGIDAASHQGSLATGSMAVLPGGIDVCYPPEHQDLYHALGQKGALWAEMPWGTGPYPQLFARRNRLISGMSKVCVVVEAALRSGSLITARCAADQSRDVFAVPGFPLDPRCQGPNRLIKEGAYLLEKAQDILDQLQTLSICAEVETPTYQETVTDWDTEKLAHERETLFQWVGTSPVLIDDLIEQMQIAPGLVLALLLELEIAGRIRRLEGCRVVRAVESENF